MKVYNIQVAFPYSIFMVNATNSSSVHFDVIMQKKEMNYSTKDFAIFAISKVFKSVFESLKNKTLMR